MARDLKVGLELTIKDSASATVSKALQTLAREGKEAGAAINGLARSGKELNAIAQAPQTVSRGLQELARQSKVAEQAVGGLGYKVRELGRTPAATSTIAGLRQIVQQANLAERSIRMLGTGIKGLQAYGTGVGAVMAGSYVLAQPMRRVANYDMRLAHMANTAFNDTDLDGRKLSVDEQLQRRRNGKEQLEGYVRAATLEGGSRDDNAAALDKLIARNVFTPEEAGEILPMISRAATAAGASTEEMTGVAMAAVQNAKIPVEQIPKALGMALRAGQLGGFELKDMATWLPKMLAMGGLSGLRGTDGLASILAASQLAVTAAGSPDDAGNNVVNFLQKITSSDTANDFKKIGSRTLTDRKKGEKGIDLYGTLSAARKEGMDPVEAFTRLVRKVAESDKEFTRLQRMAGEAKDDKDKSAMYSSMADILQARGVGKTVQDRQAMLALLPMLLDPDAYQKVKKGIMEGGAQDVDTNHRFIKEQAGFKFQQAQNLKDQGEYDSIGKLNNAVGEVADKLTEYGAQYPGLVASITGTTTALNALSAAAMAGGLLSLLRGGGGVGAASGPVAKVAGAAKDAAKSLFPLGSGAVAAAAAIGALPLAVMGLAAKKAGETEKDNDRAQSLLGFTDTLKSWLDQLGFNKDADIEERRRKNRAELNDDPEQLISPQGTETLPGRIAAEFDRVYKSTPIPLHVTVDVQNGNIVAAVNAENSRNARRN
ncbi:phage tail tape measure protein [Laribacter hongkongensis]|uniref:phage tail tape measure protein n=1 Tax=Laribacter hongkongensis TaxID=168471 RepID=UPI001EFDD513|nr:phage tail tape measure protein [Laribacter hongkongensis]MCG9087358.1 phage tail tape measure protein [Laribacter hongkongensis]